MHTHSPRSAVSRLRAAAAMLLVAASSVAGIVVPSGSVEVAAPRWFDGGIKSSAVFSCAGIIFGNP